MVAMAVTHMADSVEPMDPTYDQEEPMELDPPPAWLPSTLHCARAPLYHPYVFQTPDKRTQVGPKMEDTAISIEVAIESPPKGKAVPFCSVLHQKASIRDYMGAELKETAFEADGNGQVNLKNPVPCSTTVRNQGFGKGH
ncbi:hypothetical protein llap_3730 [Limosa lapponica baueri]|uniref:Uncharacterized protein n=1 Tax=Limosa lapponica baueri TaxID=1758121 RepID=A0A2I0UIT4_LIMLA|nr:hypothetical protein llap_3730 [Limosa lapponica baueri]